MTSIRLALRATDFRATVETARGYIEVRIRSYIDEETGREEFNAHGWDYRRDSDDGEYFDVGKGRYGHGLDYASFDAVVAACDAKVAEMTAGDASARPCTLPGLRGLMGRVGDVSLGELAMLSGKAAAEA